jgi:hypothetical protein
MNEKALEILKEKACASIRYRVSKEILEENPDINDYLDEILDDERVKYVFTWQRADGFLGQIIHGGWIPEVKMKFAGRGAEGALRFLSEMGVPKNYPVVEKGLNALLKDDWNRDPWKWSREYKSEDGLYGADHVRAVIFSYFGIEEHDFIKTEMQRTLEVIGRVKEIRSIESITGTYHKKPYFSSGIALPDLYHLKLLAYTGGWRNGKNITEVAKALEHLLELSPIPQIYIKAGNQLIAPAAIQPFDLIKEGLSSIMPGDWYFWLRAMEIYARMGVVKKIPVFRQQVTELKKMLAAGDGFFPIKPTNSNYYRKWSVYVGMALEDIWKNDRWKYDLTFRALLILKYADML